MQYEKYHDIIASNIDGVYQDGIATKILQHMDRIRNMSDISQARRWVMELLQNARDCSYKDTGVKVRIELKSNELVFSHSGKPFRIKDVLSIINQVTSKASSEETIGQFGTGFMSTFLLSDNVTIHSVLKEEGLPYKHFTISMDRSSNDKDGILEGIAKTTSELDMVDDSEEITDFNKEDYNTVFSYPLKDSYHYNIAKTGFEDLKETILYVMLFSDPLKEIELISHEDGEKRVCYTRGEDIGMGSALRILAINNEGILNGVKINSDDNHILYYTDNGLTLAAAYDNEKHFNVFSDKLPRIFADFPLIGAEEFPFPVILNNRNFKVNEPRSGITLVDNENSPDAKANKDIIRTAVIMYERFLKDALESGYKSLENIVEIPKWRESKEMSEAWVKANIYDAVYKIVSAVPMIETVKGLRSLADTDVVLPAPVEYPEDNPETVIRTDPWDGQDEKKAALSDLLTATQEYTVPVGSECWLKAFSGYAQHTDKMITLKDVAEKAREFLNKLDESKMTPFAWLQKLYDACLEEESLKTAIAAGQIAIFPSQNEDDWKNNELHTNREIYLDNDIPEIIKDVTEELDRLFSTGPLVLRKGLLHKDFKIGEKEIEPYPIERISEFISQRSARSYRAQMFSYHQSNFLDAWHNAWNMLVSCGPDEDFYRMAARVRDGLEAYEPIGTDTFTKSMWKSTYCSMLEEIADEVVAASTLDGLIKKYSALQNGDEVCQWINDYVNCARNYLSELSCNIYPDQNGKLQNLISLSKDTMKYEELKDIMEVFSDQDNEYAVRGKLLDKRIVNTFQYINNYTDKDAASKIGIRIDTLLATASLSEASDNYQEACTKLLFWIRNHMDEARIYFPSYCSEENQMKLLTARAAVILQRKADDMEDIMREFGVSTAEDLKKKIKKILDDEGSEEVSETASGGFNSECDVFYGPDLDGASEDVYREIGVGGEKYALKKVVEYIKEKGYSLLSEEPERRYILSGTSDESGKRKDIEVLYADNDKHHQAGYDIKVTVSAYGDNDSVEDTKVYYLEVKTHTPTSEVRDRIILSDEQMIMAASEGDHYSILNVVYDRFIKDGTDITELKNPVSLIGNRKLVNLRKGYLFHINKVA